MRVLVTGSREHPEPQFVKSVLSSLKLCKDDTVVVGDNSSGPFSVDYVTNLYFTDLGIPVEVHYANWSDYGRAAGPKRNQAMVDSGADFVLAFPYGDSRGTRNCINLARKADIKVYVFEIYDQGGS